MEYLGIEGSDEGRSWCAGKLWVCGVRLGRLERDTSACTHQAQRLKKVAEKRAFLFPNGPGRAWRVQIRFGAGFCVEPVKMQVLSGQIATFV